MNDVSTKLVVRTLIERPREGNRHIELLFSQPLLVHGDYRCVTPGDIALDHMEDYSPLMQCILRELFGPVDIGVTQVVILPVYLIIDHYAALTLERISEIFRQAAQAVGMDYDPRFGS